MTINLPEGDALLSLTGDEHGHLMAFVHDYRTKLGREFLPQSTVDACAALLYSLNRKDPPAVKEDFTGKVIRWRVPPTVQSPGRECTADCFEMRGDYCLTSLGVVHRSYVTAVGEKGAQDMRYAPQPPLNFKPDDETEVFTRLNAPL